MRLHHVQLALPRGGEDAARRFYAAGLGLTEVEKPEPLRVRGGAWFRGCDDAGAVVCEIHLGVEEPFAPARKAHPGLVLDDLGALESVAVRLTGLGFEVDRSERDTFAPYRRFHTHDAAGNRVEVLAPRESP